MKLLQIEATTLPDAWYQTLYAAVDNGRIFTIDRGSYAGQKRLEFDYVTVHVKYPGKTPLIPTIPEGSNLPPPVTEDYLDDYLPYLLTGELKPGESYTYGQRLCKMPLDSRITGDRRPGIYIDADDWAPPAVVKEPLPIIYPGFPPMPMMHFYLNQIELLIHTYKKYGYRNNQMVLQVAQPVDMLLCDPPCLRHVDTRIQDGKLHFFPYFRSWDLFNGFPANLAGIELVKQYCAAEIGVENGEIVAASKGLHLYDHVWSIAEILRGKKIQENT